MIVCSCTFAARNCPSPNGKSVSEYMLSERRLINRVAHSLYRRSRGSLQPAGILDGLRDAVGFARVDRLACLLDLFQDGGIVESGLGGDIGGLGFKRDVVFLDAWQGGWSATASSHCGQRDLPSSFLRTRSTAPEQPPQLMLTLNL